MPGVAMQGSAKKIRVRCDFSVTTSHAQSAPDLPLCPFPGVRCAMKNHTSHVAVASKTQNLIHI